MYKSHPMKLRNADPRSSVAWILLHMILHFSLSCHTSRTPLSAYIHLPPINPLACQIHLLFLPGTLPSPHASLPQLCASQHFLNFLPSLSIACFAEKPAHATQQIMVIYCLLHSSISHWSTDGGTHTLDVWCIPQASVFCTGIY